MAETISEALYKNILADTTFTALFTNGVHWLNAPQNTEPPYLVWFQVSDPNDEITMSYDGGAARFQFSIFHRNPFTASDLQAEVKMKIEALVSPIEDFYLIRARVTNEQNIPADENGIYNFITDSIFEWEK